jgi:hypothetical protein
MTPDLNKLADRVGKNPRGWLPGVGHVVNVAFDVEEASLVERVLRDAALPTIAHTLAREGYPRPEDHVSEGKPSIRIVSMSYITPEQEAERQVLEAILAKTHEAIALLDARLTPYPPDPQIETQACDVLPWPGPRSAQSPCSQGADDQG